MNTAILESLVGIVKTHKRIGLFVSGGFDSTLLTYLIHDIRQKLGTNNDITFFTIPRYDDSTVHAERIVKFIDGRFNTTPTKHVSVGDPNLHHSKQVLSGIVETLKGTDFDVLLLGDNTVPPEIEVPGGPIRVKSNTERVIQPFFDLTKDQTIQLAIDLGLTEIMEMSHTCTESLTLRCNICWQCRERAWAFKKCNYTDPGTM